jgi:hypothetical protein
MDHLRYSGQPFDRQRAALEAMLRGDAVMMRVLTTLRTASLPDWLVVSGAIYNLVWNTLTGRPAQQGIKDIDVFYFDGGDLSYEAEDIVISHVAGLFADLPVPVEVRNQARVHLWFPERFGQPFAPLKASAEMLTRFASKTHAVGVRLDADDRLLVHAPFGLDDVFSFRIVPNPVVDNRVTHQRKAARAKSVWPELEVIAWPD